MLELPNIIIAFASQHPFPMRIVCKLNQVRFELPILIQ